MTRDSHTTLPPCAQCKTLSEAQVLKAGVGLRNPEHLNLDNLIQVHIHLKLGRKPREGLGEPTEKPIFLEGAPTAA